MKKTIQIDTREKKNQHILDIFDKESSIVYFSNKLVVGDYCNLKDNALRVVERKNSIDELAQCLGTEHIRFRNELKRAKDLGFEVIILIETEDACCLEDLKRWTLPPSRVQNKYSMSGDKMYRILSNYLQYYNLKIEFVPKQYSGYKIMELLQIK